MVTKLHEPANGCQPVPCSSLQHHMHNRVTSLPSGDNAWSSQKDGSRDRLLKPSMLPKQLHSPWNWCCHHPCAEQRATLPQFFSCRSIPQDNGMIISARPELDDQAWVTFTCQCCVEDRQSSLTEPVMHIDSKYRVLGPTHETLLKNIAQGDCPNLRPHGPRKSVAFRATKFRYHLTHMISYDTMNLTRFMLLKARLTRVLQIETYERVQLGCAQSPCAPR